LILNSSLAGTYSIAARVSAAADMTTTNNSASASVRIDPAVDVAISIAMPDTATIDQSLTATFTVSNKSSVAAPNLSVDIAVPSGVTISGVSQLDGVACQTQFQIVHCAMNSLAANRTVAGALSVVVHNAGAQTITAKLDGAYIDMQPQDNFAEKSVMVSGTPASAPALIPTAIEKTGGGALNLYALLALCGIALRRRVPQLLHR